MNYVRPTYRERLGALSDAELLAYARRRHANPYLSLGVAKELRRLDFQYRHLAAAAAMRANQGRQEQRRRLRAIVFSASPVGPTSGGDS